MYKILSPTLLLLSNTQSKGNRHCSLTGKSSTLFEHSHKTLCAVFRLLKKSHFHCQFIMLAPPKWINVISLEEQTAVGTVLWQIPPPTSPRRTWDMAGPRSPLKLLWNVAELTPFFWTDFCNCSFKDGQWISGLIFLLLPEINQQIP